ncbi:MAG TPA: ABC transporter permease [Vicinamibacterales bacterium]|nr:ABC transporter permease [Vicinamibacterales bacterium]
MLSTLWQDVRYAGRTLRKQPTFTAVAVLSLAVGIGLNSTIFTVVDNLLFRPRPFANPDTLVSLYTTDERGELYGSTSYPDLMDWRNAALPFDALVGHSMMFGAVSIAGDNRLVLGEVVTANYFDVLGVRPTLGRAFEARDEAGEGASPVAVISHQLWQRRFGGRIDVVGQPMTIRNRPYTVVGVAPESFNGMMPGVVADIWIPISMVADVEPAGQIDVVPSQGGQTRLQLRGTRWLFVKGRLKHGTTAAIAGEQLRSVMTSLEQAYPVSNRNRRATILPAGTVRFHPDVDQYLKPAGLVLLASVGLVLLVACANLAGMLLARGAARTKEMAVRSAMGADRARLIQQLTIESLVLSTLGGAVGLVLATLSTSWIVTRQLPIELPITFAMTVDWRLLAFTAGLSVVTGLLFGLVPAFRASRPDLVPALKDESSMAIRGRRFNLRQGLVVAQVAVSVVLLVGGVLLTRSLTAALNTDPGFGVRGLVVATFSLDMHGYDDGRAQQYIERALDRTRQLPGVQAVAVADRLPFSPNVHTTTIVIDGRPEATPPQGLSVDANSVSDGYFDALGVPLIKGRSFDTRDTPASPQVAVVSETFANRYFPAGAIGQHLRRRDQSGPLVEIIGVSRDYNVRSVAETPRPVVHFARSQRPSSAASLIVRTASDQAGTVVGVERALRDLEPKLVFLELGPLDRLVAASLLAVSLGASLFGGLAGLAMLLAGLGLYGVIAFGVARRTREIGIRMALGSTRRVVIRQVLREAVILVVTGAALGSVLAWFATRALSTVLVGVTASDPASYAIAIALIGVTAIAAAVVPARRAASVDPLIALRTT